MKRKRYALTCTILILLLIAGIALDLNAGYAKIPLSELFTGNPVLLNLRLPRVLACVLVGAGLSLSGSVLQGVTRNDMAEPGLLGINAGAGLAIAAYILFVQGGHTNYSVMMPILAFIGSGTVFLIEYRLASKNGKVSSKKLLLVGVAISLAVSSLTTILMLRMPDSEYAFVQNWIAGNIWGADWQGVIMLTVGILLIGSVIYYFSRTLNGLMLGHSIAVGIGIDPPKASRRFLTGAIALSALCASVGGGLSFIGLIAPHLCRRLVGPNYQNLLPACALCGGVIMVFADIISRTWFLPYEMPVGITAAIIGAPYFLYLLVKE
ncbi:FecCD family ABC transporter permease [Allobaculum mucilyticum]|uniref:FecCD family ABC transporter permease n=1 Tax=Allobaculum mucilyticum TaxID=2834459 RepID=UPI001E38E4DE|nr:iron ABC transporter permease [Allobaculum mucilyticum]UNT95556.1 iron ABC transporter permease [Allobaculum mucilyticum]